MYTKSNVMKMYYFVGNTWFLKTCDIRIPYNVMLHDMGRWEIVPYTLMQVYICCARHTLPSTSKLHIIGEKAAHNCSIKF